MNDRTCGAQSAVSKNSKQPGSGRWRFHDVCDALWAGDQMYDHRSTRAESLRFPKVTEWPVKGDKFWRVTREYADEDARKAGGLTGDEARRDTNRH